MPDPKERFSNRVANYIRYAWGHELPPIEVDVVKKVQKETVNRESPWTLEELEALK